MYTITSLCYDVSIQLSEYPYIELIAKHKHCQPGQAKQSFNDTVIDVELTVMHYKRIIDQTWDAM